MTVAELYAALAGMQADRVVHVRIQGVSRPLEGVFTETEVRMTAEAAARRPARWDQVDPNEVIETEEIQRLILSDRKYH